jgi:uncharacterized membrane protein
VLIDFVGGLVIAGYAAAAVAALVRGRPVRHVRLLLAEGVIAGLSLKVAGTLLKTIDLHTWDQILRFSAVLALRTVLKQLFTWEQRHLAGRGSVGRA